MRSVNRFSAVSLAVLIPAVSFALKNDVALPYHITSDQAVFYRDKHTAIFTGSVKADQGSSHLDGNKLVLFFDKANKGVIHLIDYGKPATYSTQLENKKDRLNAKAEIIHYYPPTHFVILMQNALAIEGLDKIAGNYITYDMNAEIIKSKPMKNNVKTVITIQPQDTKS